MRGIKDGRDKIMKHVNTLTVRNRLGETIESLRDRRIGKKDSVDVLRELRGYGA